MYYVPFLEESYLLVYWEEEDAVSVIATHQVEGEPKQGELCKVKIKRKMYTGRVASIGKDSVHV